MYIEPNTTVKLLHNCPLDTTYDHTIYFGSASAQQSYFSGLAKYTLSNQTYQRVNRGRMRVQYKADDLYDCNYLMFQNTNFGSKWFYAFVKSVEYVNNITSEITFELDVMQTWFFDYTLGQCFVEREHAATDEIGDNLVPENLETGDYVSDDFDASGVLGAKSIVVGATFTEKDGSPVDAAGGIYGGIFSGLHYTVFDNTVEGAQQFQTFIDNAGSKIDGIVCVFLMPTALVTPKGGNGPVLTVNKDKKTSLLRADGTAVKNKKVLTYPYNFLYVSNMQGNAAAYRYEYFSGDTCSFTVAGDMSPQPCAVLAPNQYLGTPFVNYDEKLVLSGFPQLSYNVDSFKRWVGNSGLSYAVNGIAGLGSAAGAVGRASAAHAAATAAGTAAAAGTATLATLGAGVAVFSAVAGLLVPAVKHTIEPDQARGAIGGQLMAQLGLLDFCFMHKHIRPEFVTVIDDYFSAFGYATHKLKVPNRNVRKNWTYTKTVGCVIHGSVPADDAKRICGIYDNGITFWTSGAAIGNYSLDNSIVT